jgi:hypothetical protein
MAYAGLAEKKKLISALGKYTQIDLSSYLLWLDDPLSSPFKLKEVNISKKYPFAISLSVMHCIDEEIKVNNNFKVTQFINASKMLYAHLIDDYVASNLPTDDLKFYQDWQVLFRADMSLIHIYAAVMYKGISHTERDIKFWILSAIDEDKKYVLTLNMNDMHETLHNFKFRAMGFVPQTPLMSAGELMNKYLDGSEDATIEDLKSLILGDKDNILILHYKTISQIDIDSWVLRDHIRTKKLLGDYVTYRGLNKGVVSRYTNIKYLCGDNKCSDNGKSIQKILGNKDNFTGGYVLETLGNNLWRFACPFIAAKQFRVPRHLLLPLVGYINDETQLSGIAAYHMHNTRIIVNNMFFNRAMRPSVEYLESLSQEADMASVKHSILTELEHSIFPIKTEIKSFYNALSYIQSIELKDTIISVLMNKFNELNKMDEFKSVLDKSSFPTSEILLSYIIEMKKFAHVLNKAIIDNITDRQSEFNKGTGMNTESLIRDAIHTAITEKIQQEGSIISVISFKTHLLYVDQLNS